jgi:ABC-2 type transport system permease protein
MSAFAGTGQLVRLIIRRDRIRLVVWIAALAVTVVSTAQAFQDLYPDPRDLAKFAAGLQSNPAFVAINGPAYNLETIGGVTAWRIVGITAILAALMSLFHIGRHTRAEEESGRAELLRAGPTGRYAAPTAALVTILAAQLVLGGVIAGGLIGLGLSAASSIALGAAITGAGWAFAGIALLAAQLAESVRTVYGIAGAILGAAFVLRAAGDVGDGTLSWLSPIGWAQSVRAFADERWWVFGLFVALCAATVAGAFALASRRDVGAGVIRPRPGPANASPALSGPLGLAVRLQRGTILGWTVGVFLGGLAIGSVANSVGGLLDSSPELRQYFDRLGGSGLIEDSYLAATLGIFGLMAAAYGVSGALRLRTEESSVRAEPILATPVPRVRWVLSHLVVVLVGVAVVLAAAGLGAGITYAASTGDAGQVVRLVGAALVQTPAAWLLAGLAVALFGLAPRVLAIAWAALVFCLLIGQLGPLLQLADWVMDLSPFSHLPQVPAVTVTATPLAVLTAVAVALMAAGLAAFRRRDLG